MEYEIKGGQLPVVVCHLQKDEKVFTESGGMCWMDDGFEMYANTRGGLLKGLGRAMAGESIFLTTYTAGNDNSEIAFGSSFPGKILPITLGDGECIIIQKTAFLAAEDSVTLQPFFRKRLGAGFFGGEGFIMQRLSGQGMAFVEFDGYIKEYMLQPGQSIIVDTGYLAAMDSSCSIDIQTVPGLKNIMFGGEGVFNTVVTGPGRVFLQSMPISQMAGCLRPYLPSGK